MATFQNPSFIGHYSKAPSAIPGMYNGMRVEVLDSENEMLFVADLQVLSADMIELVRTSELLRPGLGKGAIPVSIRGFNAYENVGVHVDGMLSKLARDQDSAWIVKELDVKGKDTGRSFSRRPIKAKAWVCQEDVAQAKWAPCDVVNASAGGVCFRTTEAFSVGDKLSIRFNLRRGKEQPPVTVAVRRANSRGEGYEYGCEFVDLNSEVDAIITKTIIQLQIMQ